MNCTIKTKSFALFFFLQLVANLFLDAQNYDFYHGSTYEGAKWIYENRLTPRTLSEMGIRGHDEKPPWIKYTDFGKGFYTSPPGQYELAVKWAKRMTQNACQPGQKEGYWGVVIFHVDPKLLEPIDVGSPERALYFQGKRNATWNAPWSQTQPGLRMNWLEFVEYNRRSETWDSQGYRIQRPGDYDWSEHYAWIQGPMWVPKDSGQDGGGPVFPDNVLQRNWLQEGLDRVLNVSSSWRELKWGTVPCNAEGTETDDNSYGVFLAKNDILVGVKSKLESIKTCNLSGWGINCEKTVGQVTSLKLISGPYSSKEEAINWYCQNIIPGSYYRPPLASFLQGAKFRFDNENHMISNAPGCRR